jgi:hypothetical protein
MSDVPWSESYWIGRYAAGGFSGIGSRGELAWFKAEVVNRLVADYGLVSIIEHGCGDGYQLGLFKVASYVGFDVSPAAVEACRKQHTADPTRRFELAADYRGEVADAALSLDVIYHLVEDAVYGAYMARLFASAARLIVIYSSNFDGPRRRHERPREFTKWVVEQAAGWRLVERVPNRFPYDPRSGQGSLADFYIYRREPNAELPT